MHCPALTIESLSLSLENKPILRDVSLQVGQGEIWSIIGPNGAGKSTLLKCLMRILHGWKGHVRLRDAELEKLSQRELARQIAYVPQSNSSQSFPYTVREFVRMGRYAWSGPFGTRHKEDETAIEEAMGMTDTLCFANRFMDGLSGGERQKVFMASALAQKGAILLLDEPTAFLDYHHQAEIAKIIQTLNKQRQTTILNVTHDVNAAMFAGGHVLALREGQVAWKGSVDELANENTLNLIFGARFRFLDDPVSGLRLVAPQGNRLSA
jgi:iron complex transport system ATP-binding protein